MSNRRKLRRRAQPDIEAIYQGMCHGFDGREHPVRLSADQCELYVVTDAIAGRDQGGNTGNACFLWWALRAYEQMAKLRQSTVDAQFALVAAKVTEATGRMADHAVNLEALEQKGCLGKSCYSQIGAVRRAEALRATGTDVSPYRCLFCRSYHVGHPPSIGTMEELAAAAHEIAETGYGSHRPVDDAPLPRIQTRRGGRRREG